MSDIILGQLVDGGDLRVDIPTLVDARALITGNSGAGKSRLLRRLAEQAFGKVQQIIIDPEGEFSTLRERHDFLLAGRGGEVPAEPRAAALLARRLMELRASAILDLYDLKLDEQRSFVRLFLESLLSLPRDQYRPVLVMIDEAHRYVPEAGHGEAQSTAAVTELMCQGRKRGLCGILASQRLSKIGKDAAAEAANAFIGRTTLDTDQKRAADALGISKGQAVALRDLENGVFHAYGPALNHKGVVLFRGGEVLTTHPKAGQRHKVEPPAPPDAIRRLADELKDLPQQAEQELRTEQELRAKVRELSRDLKAHRCPTVPAAAPPPKAREVPVLKDSQAKRLEALAQKMIDEAERHGKAMAAFWENQDEGWTALLAALRAVATAQDAPRQVAAAPVPRSRPVAVPRPAAPKRDGGSDGSLSGPEQKILDSLLEMEMLGIEKPSRPQLGVWCGYTNHRSGGFTEPLGRLNETGLVIYPDRGLVALTGAGRDLASQPDEVTTTSALQERILRKLDGPQEKILKAVIAAYPNSLEREVLGESVGYKNHRSGGFTEPLGHLKTLGLVEYPGSGKVKARPVLFLEGA